MNHSATAETVVSPSAVFDGKVERESITLSIYAKDLRGSRMHSRTRIVYRWTRYGKSTLPGEVDRDTRESEKNEEKKGEKSRTEIRSGDQSRVGRWQKSLDGGV